MRITHLVSPSFPAFALGPLGLDRAVEMHTDMKGLGVWCSGVGFGVQGGLRSQWRCSSMVAARSESCHY